MDDLSHTFYKMFDLPFCWYWQGIFGFDIVKFDRDIKTPNDMSCAEWIQSQYGEDARILIENLLSINP